jgi:(p)ppGpp synthase/HD superfamily hydrolase
MKLNDAFAFACAHHAGKTKPGTGAPFLYHPLAVASLALKHGGGEDQAVAALLHDTIGDGKVTESDLSGKFGPEVARLVFAFTDPPLPPGADWTATRKAYLEKLATLDEAALFVIACEELHEISDLMIDQRFKGPAAWKRFAAPAMSVFWYFRELLQVLYKKLSAERYRPLVAEFGGQVKEMSGIVFEEGKLD